MQLSSISVRGRSRTGLGKLGDLDKGGGAWPLQQLVLACLPSMAKSHCLATCVRAQTFHRVLQAGRPTLIISLPYDQEPSKASKVQACGASEARGVWLLLRLPPSGAGGACSAAGRRWVMSSHGQL